MPKTLFRMLCFGLSLVVLAVAIPPTTQAEAPSAVLADASAGPQSLPTATCGDLDFQAASPSFTPIGSGAIWTTHNGCHANLTCESNCQISCSGTTCSVGTDYVECDGQRKYCPTCEVSAYPGYPPCGLRLCPWCTCVSNGWGTGEECCNL
jgi:hypothetical protein